MTTERSTTMLLQCRNCGGMIGVDPSPPRLTETADAVTITTTVTTLPCVACGQAIWDVVGFPATITEVCAMQASPDEDTCPACGDQVLQEDTLYTDGDTVACPSCAVVLRVCCSPEDGLHLHTEEDDDEG